METDLIYSLSANCGVSCYDCQGQLAETRFDVEPLWLLLELLRYSKLLLGT